MESQDTKENTIVTPQSSKTKREKAHKIDYLDREIFTVFDKKNIFSDEEVGTVRMAFLKSMIYKRKKK